MTDYRALCAELHAALEKHDLSLADDQLLDRSAAALRAPLAQPEPEGPQPVPVSERLPGPDDCDADENCWWFDNDDYKWCLESPYMGTRLLCWTHWLPANALPTPDATNAQ